MVFEQVPTCLRQLLGVQAWIFSMGHLEGEKLVAWGVGGRSPALPSPGKYPSGMLLPRAGKKHHHHFFPDKFFLWYLPLTGPLGVQQQQSRLLPGTAPARGTLRSYENIPPTHAVTGSWEQSLSLVQNQAPQHPTEPCLAMQHPVLCDLTHLQSPCMPEGCGWPMSPCNPPAPC